MVKQKNHTARNASYKAHRNGIKKGIKQRYMALKGVSRSRCFTVVVVVSVMFRAPLTCCSRLFPLALPPLPSQPAFRQAGPASSKNRG